MTAAINSHSGIPHKSTLRKPLLYTASVMVPSRKIQIMAGVCACTALDSQARGVTQ